MATSAVRAAGAGTAIRGRLGGMTPKLSVKPLYQPEMSPSVSGSASIELKPSIQLTSPEPSGVAREDAQYSDASPTPVSSHQKLSTKYPADS